MSSPGADGPMGRQTAKSPKKQRENYNGTHTRRGAQCYESLAGVLTASASQEG